MIVLVGPSASGKTEIAKILMNHFGYQKCVTTTTRNMRAGEVSGIDYHFVSKDIFRKLKSEGAFVETMTYHDNFYGLQAKDLKPNGVVVLDPEGVLHILSFDVEAFIVYIQTEKAVRTQRMKKRGDQKALMAERLLKDDELFDVNKIKRIDLLVENNHENLMDICTYIHQAYTLNLIRKEV